MKHACRKNCAVTERTHKLPFFIISFNLTGVSELKVGFGIYSWWMINNGSNLILQRRRGPRDQ